jgi:acyl-coenzyme A synthetase/AMP-(fatty) acid ligase
VLQGARMYLIDMISYWAKVQPYRHALVQPDLITTYKALFDAIESCGLRIEELQLDRSEPIGISITNPSVFAAATFAALRCGYSAAMVRTALLPLLHPIGVRNLIYDSQGLMLSGGRNIRFDPSWIVGGKLTQRPARRSVVNGHADVIFFTSGTTGLPKKVAQPLRALEILLQYPLTCASGPGDKILIMPGLTTTLGFNRLCEVLNAGKTACFAPDATSALALIDLHRIETAVTSAAQAADLAKTKNARPGYCIDSLQSLYVAGGKVDSEGIAAIRATLCRNVINQYGSTEAGVAALTPFDLIDDECGAIPLPWTELEVVDDQGRPLPSKTEGHIRYRTPQLAENLKGSSGKDIPGVRDGWFYPGDIGVLSTDGVLRLAGRSSDVINRGGLKVSGTRIEEILRALPQIKDAAACGVPGPSGLEEIWIAVVPNGEAETERIEDEIGKALREHVEVGVEPDEVFLFDTLPLGELGKVQKPRLKELMLERRKAAQAILAE